jgi:ketosteroid isomerase-like protein
LPSRFTTETQRHRGGIVLCASVSLWLFGFADLRTDWKALVDAERSFARASFSEGTKAAFLLFLADNSTLFKPRAVPGKKWTQDNPAPTSQLSWAPEFADISGAGDLGFTTGPWEFRRSPQDPPAAFGHYVTVWRKQASGEWKVELDVGIGHEKTLVPAKVSSSNLPKVNAPVSSADARAANVSLQTDDRAASSQLAAYFANDVRLYREDHFPFVGKTAAAKYLSENPGILMTSPSASSISASADFGYTYGTAEFKPRDTAKEIAYSNYLRIWKKQSNGSWKIVLDLLSAAPKP